MNPCLIFLTLCFPMALSNEAAIQEFTTGNNLFTSEVYTEISKNEPENFLFSPLSAETILALTQSGAKEATGKEVRSALHLPESQEKIQTAVKSLQPVLRVSEPYSLKTANKIYVKKGVEIKDDFKKIAEDSFASEIQNIDFNAGVAAAATINKWVEDQTNNKIRNLISPEGLTKDTRVILINALYFKGKWANAFEYYKTHQANFYKSDSQNITVDTMHETSTMRFFDNKELNAKFLELPIEGKDVSLTIVLPNEKNGLPTLEKSINKVFQAPSYEDTLVKLALPKFKIESRLDFKNILQQLGVKKIFEDDKADLSGIAGNKTELVVDKVIQQTFVDVNEEGVEAAASTFVDVVVPLSGYVNLIPPTEFIVDHPFLFYLKLKDLVIFAGRVVDPSK